jgi:uncharacterized small protein (DUF1192 family)
MVFITNKLRDTEVPRSMMHRLDEKTGALEEEIRRLKTLRRRPDQDQRAAANKRR